MSKSKIFTNYSETIKQRSRAESISILEKWLEWTADDRVMTLLDRKAVEARISKWMSEQEGTREEAIQELSTVIPYMAEILSADLGTFSLPADCPSAGYLTVAQSIFEALADAQLQDDAIEEWRVDQVHFWKTLFAVLECVDPDRIRRCLQCNRIFYASRGNKKMCSDACGNLRRVQKSQRKHKEKSAEYAAAKNAQKGKIATKGAQYKRDYRNSPGAKRARKNRSK